MHSTVKLQVLCSAVAVALTGYLCNSVWTSSSTLLQCEEFREDARVGGGMARYLGTKLPYQFHAKVGNESSVNGCTADKVN